MLRAAAAMVCARACSSTVRQPAAPPAARARSRRRWPPRWRPRRRSAEPRRASRRCHRPPIARPRSPLPARASCRTRAEPSSICRRPDGASGSTRRTFASMRRNDDREGHAIWNAPNAVAREADGRDMDVDLGGAVVMSPVTTSSCGDTTPPRPWPARRPSRTPRRRSARRVAGLPSWNDALHAGSPRGRRRHVAEAHRAGAVLVVQGPAPSPRGRRSPPGGR